MRVANFIAALCLALGAFALYFQQGKPGIAAATCAYVIVIVLNMVVAERCAKFSGEEAQLEAELRKARLRRQIAEVMQNPSA
jgi:hypothetical protein